MLQDKPSKHIFETTLAVLAIAIVLSCAIFIVVVLLNTDKPYPEEHCVEDVRGRDICRTQTDWGNKLGEHRD